MHNTYLRMHVFLYVYTESVKNRQLPGMYNYCLSVLLTPAPDDYQQTNTMVTINSGTRCLAIGISEDGVVEGPEQFRVRGLVDNDIMMSATVTILDSGNVYTARA